MTSLLGLALPPLAGLLAATDGSGDLGAYGPLINLGAIGVVCALLIPFARSAYRREVARADKAEAELSALNRELRERYVPMMTDVVRVLGEATAAMRERERR